MVNVDILAKIKKKQKVKTIAVAFVLLVGIVCLNVVAAMLGKYGFICIPVGLILIIALNFFLTKGDEDLVCPNCKKPILMESKYPVRGYLQYPEKCYFCRIDFSSKEKQHESSCT